MAKRKKKPAPTRRARSRAEKLVVRQRVEELVKLRLGGAAFWDVREYVREQEQTPETTAPGTAPLLSPWRIPHGAGPLSDSQLREYVRRADAAICRSGREKSSKALSRHFAQRRDLYARAQLAGDLRTALAVLQDEARLKGLYPAEKHRHRVKLRVVLVQDDDWYSNQAHERAADRLAAGAPAAIAGVAGSGPLQDRGRGPPLGQDGNGTAGNGAGPRPDAGDAPGGD